MDTQKNDEKIIETKNEQLNEQPTEQQTEQEQPQEVIEVTVSHETAFNLKIQEFDKIIALAEQKVAELKAQKMIFIYDSNLTAITEQHKSALIRKQAEEEINRRMAKR